jgi:hypothetical protein
MRPFLRSTANCHPHTVRTGVLALPRPISTKVLKKIIEGQVSVRTFKILCVSLRQNVKCKAKRLKLVFLNIF